MSCSQTAVRPSQNGAHGGAVSVLCVFSKDEEGMGLVRGLYLTVRASLMFLRRRTDLCVIAVCVSHLGVGSCLVAGCASMC